MTNFIIFTIAFLLGILLGLLSSFVKHKDNTKKNTNLNNSSKKLHERQKMYDKDNNTNNGNIIKFEPKKKK